MAYPTPYARGFSFTGAQTANPSAPLPGTHVDIELDSVANALSSALGALALIQRADGSLNNGLVGFDALSPAVAGLLNAFQQNGWSRLPLNVYPLRLSQFLLQVAATVSGGVERITSAVSASPDNPIRIALDYGAFVLPSDPLVSFAQTTLGLTNTQMSALLANAALQPT